MSLTSHALPTAFFGCFYIIPSLLGSSHAFGVYVRTNELIGTMRISSSLRLCDGHCVLLQALNQRGGLGLLIVVAIHSFLIALVVGAI